MKYQMTIVRTGVLFVEAGSVTEAYYIADHQTTDTVNWSDDWETIDAMEDDSLPDCICISKAAF